MSRRSGARLGLAVVIALGLAASPAAAATNSTEGRCTLTGEVIAEPFGALPADVAFRDLGRGTCTGKLNGERVDEPVITDGGGVATLSCLFGIDLGFEGTIRFTRGTRSKGDDVVIPISARAVGVAGQFVARVTGSESGQAIAHQDFLTNSDSSTFESCAANSFEGGRYTSVSQTITPLVGDGRRHPR